MIYLRVQLTCTCRANSCSSEGKLTFLDFVTEQVDLLSSGHTAGGPIHPHDLQVGGVRSL